MMTTTTTGIRQQRQQQDTAKDKIPNDDDNNDKLQNPTDTATRRDATADNDKTAKTTRLQRRRL